MSLSCQSLPCQSLSPKLLSDMPLSATAPRRGAATRLAVLCAVGMAGMVGISACGSTEAVVGQGPVATRIVVVPATDSQRAVVTTTLASPIGARVRDQSDAPLAGAPVAWAVLSGGGSVSLGISVTDANGEAATVWTLGRTAGVQRVTATLVSGVSDTIVAIGTAGAPAVFALVDGDNQTVATGQISAPLQVRALDQYGNVVPTLPVTWSTTGGTLSASQTTTAANGVASVTLLAAAGTQVVTARLANGAALTFNVRGQ